MNNAHLAADVENFCESYIWFLFNAGKWTLIAGIVLGVALGIATIVLLLRKKDGAAQRAAVANAATPTAILEAAKAFLQALSSAPTWLALFGGGVLLLWLAGSMRPSVCPCPASQAGCVRPNGDPNANAAGDAGNNSATGNETGAGNSTR